MHTKPSRNGIYPAHQVQVQAATSLEERCVSWWPRLVLYCERESNSIRAWLSIAPVVSPPPSGHFISPLSIHHPGLLPELLRHSRSLLQRKCSIKLSSTLKGKRADRGPSRFRSRCKPRS